MSQNNDGAPANRVRIAALGDLHCKTGSQGLFQALFTQMSQSADVMVLCGDLTDHGLPAEAQVLVHEMASARSVPIVGCSRLEEPLNRYQVTACVHGHAHTGSPEGRTAGGAPVYNVSLPLMRKLYPDRPPLRILELAVEKEMEAPGRGAVTSNLQAADITRPIDTTPA